MPFFVAVKPSMAIDAKGINVYPSAGPYKIASREVGRQLVLERNTYYKGNRPSNADRIVYTVNTELNQSLLQVRAGQADYDAAGLPPTAHDEPVQGRTASTRAATAATSSTRSSRRPTSR